MGADLSRVRFDAARDHSGVVMQQGRLLLDADWNEHVAIVDRRLRAGAADLGSDGPTPGIAGVAVVPRTTPAGFALTLTGGVLTIGRGRMYVDGLLAENHGTGATELAPLLDDLVGTADTPYLTQPYWPTPDALPAGGTHLVYLDVWTREVTPLEAPDLVEPAVGVDTTVRSQTVWQVRVHAPDTPGVDCATPDAAVPGWSALIAPSAGRLTTGTVPITAADDPCSLPPTGGYRGLENQTYRVEIHDGGAPGTATFSWSRDNASVASPVVEVVTATRIRPASLGKDGVLRFSTGDWLEITDDVRELDQRPGEIRKVTVHDEDGTVTFSPALPADLVMTPGQAADRHLRVRRWDQHGKIVSGSGTVLEDLDAPGATGVITVPASGEAIVLESGLTVELTAPGGVFRPGDHWIFPARTDGVPFTPTIAAPPLGVHHHYARLGVATFPDGVSDCRTPWPAECDCDDCSCTVCITPASHASGALTIQAAIDSVVPTGGTVCLAVGTYQVPQGLVMAKATSVTLRGQGSNTLIITRDAGLVVSRCTGIVLQDFAMIGTSDALVTVDSTVQFTAERLTLLAVRQDDDPVAGILLTGAAIRTTLRENLIVAPIGILGGGAEARLLTADLDVRANHLLCATSGVSFTGQATHTLRTCIAANTVGGVRDCGLRTLGAVAPTEAFTVVENTVTTASAGIEVGPGGYAVHDNDVVGAAGGRGAGIRVTEAELLASVPGATRITANSVRGVGGAAIVVDASVTDLLVTGNLVEGTGQGILMEGRATALAAVVSGNVVRQVGARESDQPSIAGILVAGADRASVESNTVVDVGTAPTADGVSAGIALLGCAESRVAGNSVDRIGPTQEPRQAFGIVVLSPFARTEVHGNCARRSDVDVDKEPSSSWTGLLVGAVGSQFGTHVIGHFLVVATENTHFLLGTGSAVAATDITSQVATVSDNIVTGGGDAPAVRVTVAGEAVLATNQAQQHRDIEGPCILLTADAATVATNVARGGRPSVVLELDPKRVAVLGNLTATGIVVGGASLAAPWAVLNPTGVV